MENLGELKNNRRKFISVIILLAEILLVIIYSIVVILFPLLSIYLTMGIIESWLLFVIILILQVIVLLFLLHFFTALSAKKELVNSLTNFADINYQISYALLSYKIDPLDFERLKNMYLTAKQYDLKIDDSFKFINLYMLIMHRVYIRAIPEVGEYMEN